MTSETHLIEADQLLSSLCAPDAPKVLDASWFMPAEERDPYAEFCSGHIPGARFFDVDGIADHTSGLPHMLPTPEDFAAALSEQGITREDWVVVYDTAGVFSAPRAWWMLCAFGHPRVSVLNGGLNSWVEAGGALAVGEPESPLGTSVYNAALNRQWLATREEVVAAVQSGSVVILDARSPGRFSGEQPEPRPGLPSGHMPGARNVPFNQLLTHGRLRDAGDLEQIFNGVGVPAGGVAITSCGSGITACVLALGLALTGRHARVYDGSWAEWASSASEQTLMDNGLLRQSFA